MLLIECFDFTGKVCFCYMTIYELSLTTPLNFNMCGKFEAPSPEWTHLTRNLTDFELFVVTEGALYIGDHRGEYTIKKGESFIMAPTNFQYGFKASDCTFYWLHFFPSSRIANDDSVFFRSFDTEQTSPVPSENSVFVPMYSNPNATDRIIVLMKQLQDSDKRYHERQLNNYLTSAIICEISNQNFLFKKYSGTNEKSQLYNDIVDFISWRVCENIRVSEIADYFGYNEKYLSTFFHRMSGVSLKQFILQTKMDHAKAELSDTNRSVSQIAYSIGFNDPHNFSNAFKKITGLTPTEYRISYSKRLLYHQ